MTEMEWSDLHPWKARFNSWVLIAVACLLPGGHRIYGPLFKALWAKVARRGTK